MTEDSVIGQEQLRILKEKYEKLLSDNPSSSVFVFLGEILRKQGELGRAADVLIRGLRHHPKSLTGRLILGRVYYEGWMVDEAKREIEEVIKSAPDNSTGSKILVQIYRSEGNLEKALAICQSVYCFNPQDDEIKNIVEEISKEIALAEGKKKLDASNLEKEILESSNEEDAESYLGFLEQEIYTETMADLYTSQGLYARTIRVYEKLIENGPENRSLRTKLERARPHLAGERTLFKTEAESNQE